jgi:two-component sensor histidine kinase
LYQTEQLSEIDFQEYADQLIDHLATVFGHPDKKINSHVNGYNIKLDIGTAIPLGLILNELVTNAYKYAFKDASGGDLKIELQIEKDQHYNLTVMDNGQGLPKDFDETKLNSLGLKLVRMLIEQLDGSVTIQSGKGTSFYIRFKETRMSA